jgi:hypothetical protein
MLDSSLAPIAPDEEEGDLITSELERNVVCPFIHQLHFLLSNFWMELCSVTITKAIDHFYSVS